MFTVLFLLFQITLVQSCNFDKGQFYHVTELGWSPGSSGQYCSSVGSTEVPREWCMDVLTDNGRLSNEYLYPTPNSIGFLGGPQEVYNLKYNREGAGHMMGIRRNYPSHYNPGVPPIIEECLGYNFSTGEASDCRTDQKLTEFVNTPMARPRGCSYHSLYRQGEHGITGNVIWRNATMKEGVADNPSPGGLNFGRCGAVKAGEIAPTGWGIFKGEGFYSPYHNNEWFYFQGSSDIGVDPDQWIATGDVCICNRPGQDLPQCISDCPLKDHPDPERYYGRCHPGKHFDSCECEYCIHGSLPFPNQDQCIRKGCTNSSSVNYNSKANVDDGSCIPVKVGCMFSIFENYDPEATSNDMSLCGELVCDKIQDLALEKECCASTAI